MMWREESGFLEMFLAYYNQFEENVSSRKAYRDFLLEVLCAHELSLTSLPSAGESTTQTRLEAAANALEFPWTVALPVEPSNPGSCSSEAEAIQVKADVFEEECAFVREIPRPSKAARLTCEREMETAGEIKTEVESAADSEQPPASISADEDVESRMELCEEKPIMFHLQKGNLPEATAALTSGAASDFDIASASGCQRDIHKVILRKLRLHSRRMDRELPNLNKRLEALEAHCGLGNPDTRRGAAVPLKLRSAEELERFKEDIKNASYREEIISSLVFHGGHSPENMGVRAVNFLLDSIFQREFNWTGRGAKKPFGALFGEILMQAVMKRFPSSNIALVERKVQRHLALAPDRTGGRSNRRRLWMASLRPEDAGPSQN